MAVSLSFNSSLSGTIVDGGTDITSSVSFTPTGTPAVVFLCVSAGMSAGGGAAMSATYGGVAMDKLLQQDGLLSSTTVFMLRNPPTGTQSTVVTFAGATGQTISTRHTILCYTGADLGVGSNAGGLAADTAPSLTVNPAPPASSNSFGVFTVEMFSGTAHTATVGTGETSRANTVIGTLSINRVRALVSTQGLSGDGIINWTLSGARDWWGQVWEVSDTAVVAKGATMMMMGV